MGERKSLAECEAFLSGDELQIHPKLSIFEDVEKLLRV